MTMSMSDDAATSEVSAWWLVVGLLVHANPSIRRRTTACDRRCYRCVIVGEGRRIRSLRKECRRESCQKQEISDIIGFWVLKRGGVMRLASTTDTETWTVQCEQGEDAGWSHSPACRCRGRYRGYLGPRLVKAALVSSSAVSDFAGDAVTALLACDEQLLCPCAGLAMLRLMFSMRETSTTHAGIASW